MLSNVACSFLRTHLNLSRVADRVTIEFSRRYFQHAHFIPVVDAGKRCEYELVRGDAKAAPVTRTLLGFTGIP